MNDYNEVDPMMPSFLRAQSPSFLGGENVDQSFKALKVVAHDMLSGCAEPDFNDIFAQCESSADSVYDVLFKKAQSVLASSILEKENLYGAIAILCLRQPPKPCEGQRIEQEDFVFMDVSSVKSFLLGFRKEKKHPAHDKM